MDLVNWYSPPNAGCFCLECRFSVPNISLQLVTKRKEPSATWTVLHFCQHCNPNPCAFVLKQTNLHAFWIDFWVNSCQSRCLDLAFQQMFIFLPWPRSHLPNSPINKALGKNDCLPSHDIWLQQLDMGRRGNILQQKPWWCDRLQALRKDDVCQNSQAQSANINSSVLQPADDCA